MSCGQACKCDGRLSDDFRKKNWVIAQFMSNRSAFNGYHETSSNYSEVRCLKCGRFWRTMAKYIKLLRMATKDDLLKAV